MAEKIAQKKKRSSNFFLWFKNMLEWKHETYIENNFMIKPCSK
jgi:hypothetical protein